MQEHQLHKREGNFKTFVRLEHTHTPTHIPYKIPTLHISTLSKPYAKYNETAFLLIYARLL